MSIKLRLNTFYARKSQTEYGFTLIELLVVIVVIAILASIAIPAYLNQRDRANEAAVKSDLRQLEQAFILAKTAGVSGMSITGSGNTTGACNVPNPETLWATHACWVRYNNSLQRLTEASGIDVTGLVDPYGRPYFIDENEGEAGGCNKDAIGFFKKGSVPTTGGYTQRLSFYIDIPHATADCLSR